MRQETYTLSQKELQRVSVISACIKGDMACARAAGLLALSVRQVKRLKNRMREDGEAALAHANRGRPSHRRLPDAMRRRIVQLARGPQLTALGMQDDATGKILGAQCFPSETAFGYLCLLKQMLRRHGVPLAFYGDHSGVFVRNDDDWTVDEQLAGKRQSTQFGRALEQLGVTFIAANSPQAKGRVERLWGVLQDRLCSELRLAGAQDLDSANAVLRKFIADYNRRFARQARESATAWRETPDRLDRICCFVHERTVSHANVVQWAGRRFQIPQQARRFSFAGAKVQIYQALDGRVSLYYGEARLQLANLPGG